MAKLTEKEIRAIAENMTDDALCGQVLCYDVYDKDDPEEVRKIVEKIKPGGLYVGQMSAEKIKMYTEMVNRVTPVPVIIAADIESGPGDVFAGEPMLPMPMAWGACNDEKLIASSLHICFNHPQKLTPSLDLSRLYHLIFCLSTYY